MYNLIHETGHVSAFCSAKLFLKDISCQNAPSEHFVHCVFCTFSLLTGPFHEIGIFSCFFFFKEVKPSIEEEKINKVECFCADNDHGGLQSSSLCSFKCLFYQIQYLPK